ncbi:MAG: ATP-dependent zinc protease [Akkermansiaceae bacterium]|nr:ATP-dependent zinc protease [Akkermansiaceae bacterium]
MEASSTVAGELALPTRGRMSSRIIIGRREWLSLPGLGVNIVTAKVDTGAYTSSLHAENMEVFERDGCEWVKFVTYTHHGDTVECEAPLVQRKKIKSSSGRGRKRLIVRTEAKLSGGFSWEVLLSLADRSVMKCPLLLGRRALSGYFVVDTQASHLLGNIKKFTGKSHHRRS